MGADDLSMPMDDASIPNDPSLNMNPESGEDNISMPEDPMGDENTQMPEDPMSSDSADGDDSTEGIIAQLNPEDKKAVRAYAESMLSKNGGKDDAIGSEDMEMPEQPLSEGIILTKKQFKMLSENFNNSDKNDEKPLNKKEKRNTISKKSPFNSPSFD